MLCISWFLNVLLLLPINSLKKYIFFLLLNAYLRKNRCIRIFENVPNLGKRVVKITDLKKNMEYKTTGKVFSLPSWFLQQLLSLICRDKDLILQKKGLSCPDPLHQSSKTLWTVPGSDAPAGQRTSALHSCSQIKRRFTLRLISVFFWILFILCLISRSRPMRERRKHCLRGQKSLIKLTDQLSR